MRRFRMYQDPNHECAAPAAVDADPDQGPEEPTTTKMYRTSKGKRSTMPCCCRF